MDILCKNEKVLSKAEELLLNYNLVVDQIECEITSVSIHSGSMISRSGDPYVHFDKSRSSDTWYPFQQPGNDHLRYLDYDMSDDFEVNGIRINSLRILENTDHYEKSCQKTFDMISNMLVGIKLLETKGEDAYSFKKLYLKKKNNISTKQIYKLPRHGDFTKKSPKLKENLRHLFSTHLFTIDLNIFKNIKNRYDQGLSIALYLFVLGKEEEAFELAGVSEDKFKAYLRTTFKASGYSPEALYGTCKNKEYLSREILCKLFGYFCIKYHEFK